MATRAAVATSQRGARSPGIRQPWFASTMISSRSPDGLPHRGDDRDVVAPVGVVEADLRRAHTGVGERHGPRRALVGPGQLAARRIREDAVERPPSSRHSGSPAALPAMSQQATSTHPRPAAVEVDGLADLAHHLALARVDADQQALQQAAVAEAVAARA